MYLQLADIVGPHICLLKMHVDIMTDFTSETASSLKRMATQHNFIIIEDRLAKLKTLCKFKETYTPVSQFAFLCLVSIC